MFRDGVGTTMVKLKKAVQGELFEGREHNAKMQIEKVFQKDEM